LILRSDGIFIDDLVNTSKEHISIEYYTEKKLTVLRLYSFEYSELFNDLIISLYNRIKSIADQPTTVKEFVNAYIKWSEFFSNKVEKKLSEESVRGLFGELVVLNDIIINSEPNYINSILLSWKGPYDAIHDFEFKEKNLEIKTKFLFAEFVCISNEYQLQEPPGKELHLYILDISYEEKGTTLHDILLQTRELILERVGSFSILLKALIEMGITYQNVEQYNDYRYRPISLSVYNPVIEDFPKIIRRQLNTAVNNVAYSLNVNHIEPFLVSKKLLNGD
jgi:hypothetical protein